MLYINDVDREPSCQCQCCLPLRCVCISQTDTDTYTYIYVRAVHTFDPDKEKSMRFLSRVHSRRAPPTVLNLMELEFVKMRERTISELEKSPGIFANFADLSDSRRINSYPVSYK